MTVRVRRQNRGIRNRLGRLVEGEERQQFLVTALFIAAIAAVVLILVGAVALAWYNDNLRPLARVGPVEIGPHLLRSRLETEQWRIERERNRLTQAQIDGVIDAQTAQVRLTALDEREQALASTGLEDLIDVIFQSQLAGQEGISVTDADVDTQLAEELASPERRHVMVIAVEPQVADEETGATASERRAARERAEAAHGELELGRPFDEVAREFSTHVSAPNGGDLGTIGELAVPDAELATAVFDLEQPGTTSIVRGNDGAYWIGNVTEIVPAGEQPGLREELFAEVPEESVRELLRYEVGAERLRDKVVEEALAETPEQARISVIYIEGISSGDPEDEEGEVDYSEIVFAPNDDLIGAPELAEDDPAWAEAQTEAEAALAELSAITDQEELETRFEEMAIDQSDAPSAEDGGLQQSMTRSTLPVALGDALFDETHEEGDLIGPIRGDAAWYVLLFHEHRASPEDRIKAVQDALAAPGADFNEVARELGEGPEAADGGDVGWLTRDQLGDDVAEQIFALEPGQISEPIEIGTGHYIVKLEEKETRALDADQIPSIRELAFEDWYEPKKDDAEENGTIVRAGEAPDGDEEDFETGDDQVLPE